MTISLPSQIHLSATHLISAYLVLHVSYAMYSHFSLMKKVKQYLQKNSEKQIDLLGIYLTLLFRMCIGLELRIGGLIIYVLMNCLRPLHRIVTLNQVSSNHSICHADFGTPFDQMFMHTEYKKYED